MSEALVAAGVRAIYSNSRSKMTRRQQRRESLDRDDGMLTDIR